MSETDQNQKQTRKRPRKGLPYLIFRSSNEMSGDSSLDPLRRACEMRLGYFLMAEVIANDT